MKWTPLQKLSMTSGAAFLLLGLGGIVAYQYASREVDADLAVAQTNTNMLTIGQIVVWTNDAERFAKAYVVRPDSLTRVALRRTQSEVEDALDAMRRATEDNPRQRQLLDHALPLVAESFREFRIAAAVRDRVGADSARRYLMREAPPHASDSLLVIIGQMRDEELRVLAERTRYQRVSGEMMSRLILLGTVLTFLLAGVVLHPVRSVVATRFSTHLAQAPDDGSFGTNPDSGGRARETSPEERLTALHRVVTALARPHETAGGARAIVEVGAAPLGAALGAVVVPDGAGGFTVLYTSNRALDGLPAGLARRVADTLRTAEPVVAESRASREKEFGPISGLEAAGVSGAMLLVPLRREAVATGVLLLAFRADGVFSTADMEFAETLGGIGGPAVVNQRPLT